MNCTTITVSNNWSLHPSDSNMSSINGTMTITLDIPLETNQTPEDVVSELRNKVKDMVSKLKDYMLLPIVTKYQFQFDGVEYKGHLPMIQQSHSDLTLKDFLIEEISSKIDVWDNRSCVMTLEQYNKIIEDL